MNGDEAAFLAALPDWLLGGALLFARTGCLCMLLPGIGEAELPVTVRLGFALALTAVLLPLVEPLMPRATAANWALARILMAEALAGVWLGWITRVWLLALPVAGQAIAAAVGLANVLQPDPTLGPQTPTIARALGLVAPVVVLASGLHAFPIMALAGSYRVIPPGALLDGGDAVTTLIAALGSSFRLSLQLAAPFVIGGIVWHAAIGMLARLVPQLQIFFAGMPGQILGGLAAIGLLAGTLIATWHARVADAFAALPGL